jgi:hypothetical protein
LDGIHGNKDSNKGESVGIKLPLFQDFGDGTRDPAFCAPQGLHHHKIDAIGLVSQPLGIQRHLIPPAFERLRDFFGLHQGEDLGVDAQFDSIGRPFAMQRQIAWIGVGDSDHVIDAAGPVGVALGVAVSVTVWLGVAVGVAVLLAVGLAVRLGLPVGVVLAVKVALGVPLGLAVGEWLGLAVGVAVGVTVGVVVGVFVIVLPTGTGLQVGEMLLVAVVVGVWLSVAVALGVAVRVALGLALGVLVRVREGVPVGVLVALAVGDAVRLTVGLLLRVGLALKLPVGVTVADAEAGVRVGEIDGVGEGSPHQSCKTKPSSCRAAVVAPWGVMANWVARLRVSLQLALLLPGLTKAAPPRSKVCRVQAVVALKGAWYHA